MQEIHLLDPLLCRYPNQYPDGCGLWRRWSEDSATRVWARAISGGAQSVRSDEDEDADGILDTIDDSDGDGLVDFDERARFGTGPTDPDDDNDGVPDKADMRDYMFDATGGRRAADWDGDGVPKERDPDNDRKLNNGSKDGCEDGNHNGKLDAGETSNFNSADDGACTTPPPTGDMVLVPAGTFQMGCDPAHNGGCWVLLR